MQTTIKVRLSELNISFLDKLKVAFAQLSPSQDPEIEIVLTEPTYDADFVSLVLHASEEIENGKKQVFTMDSLEEFMKS